MQRLRYLNREEIARLVESADESIKAVIIMAASTGMRRGEILSLKWKDVDFDNGFSRVEKSKNHDSRDIPMDKFLLETRRIMGSIWIKQGNTVKNTPVFFEGNESVEKPYQQMVPGHATN